jgi:pimeloyl-ACP methyl ester carboxylesterase
VNGASTAAEAERVVLGYELVGSGPEGVIVFNDWLADCTSWKPMHLYLDKEAFTYAFVDIRGYGRSIDIPGAHTSTQAALDAFAVADHLGWERFHIIGFSMTGMVVERMVLIDPARIKSEIAVGPVSAAAVKMEPERRAFFEKTLVDDDAVRELAARITDHRLTKEWSEHKLMLARTTRDHAAVREYLDMWTLDDFSAEMAAARPETPLLVVAGEWDQKSFLEDDMKSTFMAWHPNAELVVIRNCGHCPMQETPIYLATLVEAFMRRHAAAPVPAGG